MDFHRLIKVQLGPGAELYLSARYSSRAAQEAIWPGQSLTLTWSLLAQEACAPAFWRPRRSFSEAPFSRH